MTITSSTASAALAAYFKTQQSLARQSSARQSSNMTASSGDSAQTKASALKSANTAILQMAHLSGQVRSLSKQASSLRDSNTAGIDALRTQVSQTLTQFNTISNSTSANATVATTAPAGTTSTSASATATSSADDKPLSLTELRSQLSDMQANLRDNLGKLGASVQKALTYDGQAAASASIRSLGTSSNANKSSSDSMSALWTAIYAHQGAQSYASFLA